jgi:formate-dependent nitrite reductase cytochrome c552 subunit
VTRQPSGDAAVSVGDDSEALANAAVLRDWASTAHAANGVNCSACHAANDAAWNDRPQYDACGDCHVNESRRFELGRHGMRLAEGVGVKLPPMPVADARLPMKSPPNAEHVDCGSCHSAHRFDTQHAAVEACLGCHDDTHSRAYSGSPHDLLESAERVTCATCHMPRVEESYEWGAYVHVLVDHNQSANLRPNDAMLRGVCMQCHGLSFSLDALADRKLIDDNFSGPPGVHVPSVDWARQRRAERERQKLEQSSAAQPEVSVSTPSP